VASQLPFVPPFRQVLRGEDAWRLYVGYAGHCLSLEAGGRLPWSIAGMAADRLALLLKGEEMFAAGWDGFEVVPHTHGWAVPCAARRAWQFLVGNGLVRGTPLATVGRVLEWCRDSLRHFRDAATLDNFEAHWQYHGFPPVSRVIDGTIGPAGPAHYTGGCHGTAGFLKVVLRAVNIPVDIAHKPDDTLAHAVPAFPSLGRFLTHGDDPYNQLVRTALPSYPGTELLVTTSRFDALLGAGVPAADQARHVGVRTIELAETHLPIALLQDYCDDQAEGRDHASGAVFATLSRLDRSVAELEQAGLWDRMDRKLADLGGCGELPAGP
jgi:hypothetical protein